MSGDGPGGVRPKRFPQDVLSAAKARVASRIDAGYPPLVPGDSQRALAYLETIVAKLGEVLDGEDPAPIRAWLAASPLCPPLMAALGEELINTPDGVNDPASVLDALRAWWSVRIPPPTTPGPDEQRSEDLRARMKGPDAFELLVEVAHDFRSPLTSILFLAEALRDGHSGPVTDTQRSQLGLVYSAAFGLASIASDIMDLAREEKDLIGGEAEMFAIAEVFRSVERMVRPIVEEKGLELRVVAPDRWRGSGHPHALSRVLLNLTTNALKFTDEGFVELGVRAVPHGRVEYYVQDTGRGITPEQQRGLFRPFRKRPGGPDQGHYFSGSGIGLSIARRLLRAMGTELTLDSSDTNGTRFSFSLPTAQRR